MQHIIPIDYSTIPIDPTYPEGFYFRRLVGPRTESGIESCAFLVSRIPSGSGGLALHVHPVDQFYYILSGTLNLQLGQQFFTLEPNTLAFIPAGTPHTNWNTSSEDEFHLEFVAPPAPREKSSSRAFPKAVPNTGEPSARRMCA